ncbi:hypothetical protein [Mycolicibacterium komossense]|uniref:hypothetical protein n=1 Tax=Mycolicibacterium komossense TaxID=1779 RepID=UPI003F492304
MLSAAASIGTHQYRGALAVTQDADDAGAADSVVHLIAELIESVGHQFCGAAFLIRQLRVLVSIAVQIFLPLPNVWQSGQYITSAGHIAASPLKSLTTSATLLS